MGSGWVIKRAIKKYGIESFKKDILAETESKQFAYDLEKVVVDQSFIDREDTYNLCLGGGPPPIPQKGRKHAKHTEEAKRKIGLASLGNTYGKVLKGRRQSEEHRRKRGEALLGKKKSPEHIEKMRQARLGWKPSLETLKKMSLAHLGKKFTEEHKKALNLARSKFYVNKRQLEAK